jgi:hypothetical protein
MQLIDLIAKGESLDIHKNTMTYTTDVVADEGIILLANESGEFDMVIASPVHKGGPVSVIMKPIRTPAKKPAVGDRVAYLAVMGEIGKKQKEI